MYIRNSTQYLMTCTASTISMEMLLVRLHNVYIVTIDRLAAFMVWLRGNCRSVLLHQLLNASTMSDMTMEDSKTIAPQLT